MSDRKGMRMKTIAWRERNAQWKRLAAICPDRFHVFEHGQIIPILAGGKGDTTTVVQPAARTPEEIELLKKQNELLEIQLGEVRRQNEAYAEIFPQQKELLKSQVDIGQAQLDIWKKTISMVEAETTAGRKAGESDAEYRARQEGTAERQIALAEKSLKLQELSTQRIEDVLSGKAPVLSAEQEAQIEKYYGAAKEQGQRDIRQFAEEMAASRGLRLTDTPIGAEVLGREKEFAQALEGAKAGAKLTLGQSEQAFTQGVAQFQESLRQQAFQNRLALMGRAGAPGLPASTGNISSLLSNALTSAAGGRGSTQTQTGPGFNWAGTIAPAATLLSAPVTSGGETVPLIYNLAQSAYGALS